MSGFPDWAVPGAKALVIKRRYSTTNAIPAKILRLTKTRIVVEIDNGARAYEAQFVPDKFSEGEWSEYGRGSSWEPSAKLKPIDSAEAMEALSELRLRSIESQALLACDNFRKNRTAESAQAAVRALTAYVEAAA